MKFELASLDKTKREIKMIGISVNKGIPATMMPSFMLCFTVCEMSSINRGPGERPATAPKVIPANRKVKDSTVNGFLQVFYRSDTFDENAYLPSGRVTTHVTKF